MQKVKYVVLSPRNNKETILLEITFRITPFSLDLIIVDKILHINVFLYHHNLTRKKNPPTSEILLS